MRLAADAGCSQVEHGWRLELLHAGLAVGRRAPVAGEVEPFVI